MKIEDAKSTFLLEHCAERCEGYQNDDVCENCEINAAIKALDRMTELKKCPFCGGEAKIEEYTDGTYAVVCPSKISECELQPATYLHYDREKAIEAWNRRAE